MANQGEFSDTLKEINHTAWAIRDALDSSDVIHINNVFGLPFSRLAKTPFVYTLHHEHDSQLSEFYSHYPDVSYVTISDFQRLRESMPSRKTIHHGIDLSLYHCQEKKQQYLSFLGRIAPIKGTHLAIEVAKKTGIPLKIAGEIQPIFRDYFESAIRPHIDGRFIEYLGEADLSMKNELLGNSLALLFPIQWNEPFGLVTIEAMACGTPVLALSGGSVKEIVSDGIGGYVCDSVSDMVGRVREIDSWIRPQAIRRYAEQHFSVEQMAAEYLELYRTLQRPEPFLPEFPALEIDDQEPAAA